ncbi:hypothetical protein C0J52_13971 [Blattella germanica]|nr:hypothetical protein C0J52_13971 [Blattella germanica]
MDCVDEDLSYVALPKSGVAPLSVCLNGTFMAKDIGHLEKLAAHCQCKRTQRLLRFWAYLDRESELWNQYGVSRIFEIRILATDKRFRGRGIATALAKNSLNLAKELGFPLVRMDCTNHYSSLAAKRLGMDIAYSLKYSDYLTNNGRPIFDTPSPHQSATIYVQNINRPISQVG